MSIEILFDIPIMLIIQETRSPPLRSLHFDIIYHITARCDLWYSEKHRLENN